MSVRLARKSSLKFNKLVKGTGSAFRRLGRHSSSRIRRGEKSVLGLLEGRHRLFAADSRKVVQKLAQRVTGLQVIQERLERHSRPNKDRRTAHDQWVTVHHGCGMIGHATCLAARIPLFAWCAYSV